MRKTTTKPKKEKSTTLPLDEQEASSQPASGKQVSDKNTVEFLDREIQSLADKLGKIYKCEVYCLLLADIETQLVDRVYDDLTKKFSTGNSRLLVIVSSGGGDIDAAFNLAKLFRRYGSETLLFAIPRWAKSAATLLVCGGDQILMTPVAELGPLDPQIMVRDPIERRIERFSPLHIQSTLQLIAEQFDQKQSELGTALINRLQFPLTLGSFRKSLDVGKEYLIKLLGTRMKKGEEAAVIQKLAISLVEGFADHSSCILSDEALEIGLNVEELSGEAATLAWQIHKLERKKADLLKEEKKREMQELLQKIPPELIEKLSLD